MTKYVEDFDIGTNNLASFTLTVNGNPLVSLGNATQVDIDIGRLVQISRTESIQDGVDFSQGNGKLVINPGKLTEDLSVLQNQLYRVTIRIFDDNNQEGIVFGGPNSADSMYFSVNRPPG